VTQPAEATFSAKVLSVNGSGCAGGSAMITAKTADSLTLSVPSYSASLGSEAVDARRRQNCLFVLEVSVPAGFTYALSSASLQGTAALAAGVSGSAVTQYFFTRTGEGASSTVQIEGGTNKWASPGVFPAATVIDAPCDEPSFLSLNTSLLLTGESDTESTMSLDPSVTLTFALKKCH
jgi:hypothetical protein